MSSEPSVLSEVSSLGRKQLTKRSFSAPSLRTVKRRLVHQHEDVQRIAVFAEGSRDEA